MAQGRKYANLPGLDEAPETYETTEPVKDTQDTESSRSSSISSTYEDPASTPNTDDELASSIDRSQLHPSAARTRFGSSRVDARGVDFSDRVGGRKSYKVSRRRKKFDIEGVAGTVEREDETYAERIARLKREIEEVAALAGKEGKGEEDGNVVREMSEVLRRLDDGEASTKGVLEQPSREQDQREQRQQPSKTAAELLSLPLPNDANTTRALTLAATLESRLSVLEKALGLPTLSLPTADTTTAASTLSSTDTTTTSSTTTSTTPLLTTLSTLSTSLETLNTTTAPSLTHLSTQIATLTQRATDLANARRSALTALKDLRAAPPPLMPYPYQPSTRDSARPFSSGTTASFSTSRPSSYARSRAPTGGTTFDSTQPPPTATGADADNTQQQIQQIQFPPGITPETLSTLLSGQDSELSQKVNALHALLPTIESLAPLLPSVLERLGDLRLLHAEAAGAGEALRLVEGRLEVLGRGGGEWRDALGGLEERVKEAEVVEGENRRGVEGWVRELEGRVGALKGKGKERD